LPTPDDPLAWPTYPVAWLVVGDHITAGDGRAEGGPDWSLLPPVTLPPGVEPVMVVGATPIRDIGFWTFDLSRDAATWEPLAATRLPNELAAYTLVPLTTPAPQVLQVGVDYAHSKGVSYGWQVQVATAHGS